MTLFCVVGDQPFWERSAIIQPTWVISILDLETKTYHSSISPKIKKMLNFISSPSSFCLLEEDRAAQIFAIFKLFRFSIFSYSLSYSTTIVLMTIRMTWHFKTNSSPYILHTIKNWNNLKIFYWPKWKNKRNSTSSSEGTYIHIMSLYASVTLTLFWYLLLFFQKFLCLACGHFVGRNSALSLV